MAQHLSHLLWWISIPLLIACDGRSPNDVILSNPRDTVTVMTYNIFHDAEDPDVGVPAWSERRSAVVGTIQSHAPDVLGLQEAKPWQVAWLLEEMPEYAAVARGPYADAGLVDTETVAVLYLRERFELRESGHFWYSETPDTPGSYGSEAFGGMAAPRMATWVHLGERDAAQENGFYLFNTHFIADGRADDAGLARFKSAEVLVRRISDRAHPDAPFFVTGDLNTAPGTWPLRYLLGSRCESGDPCLEPQPDVRMTDAWAARHSGDTDAGTRCNAVTGAEGLRVDHVLVWDRAPDAGEPANILTADIVARDASCPSDHRPVAAEIVLPGPEGS